MFGKKLRKLSALVVASALAISFVPTLAPNAVAAPVMGNSYTTNPSSMNSANLFFFDFSKLADGRVYRDAKEGRPRMPISDGASYEYTQKDGLPHGVKITVSITDLTVKNYYGTPIKGDLAAAQETYNRIFESRYTNYYDVRDGYPMPSTGWWLLTQAYEDDKRANLNIDFNLNVKATRYGKDMPVNLFFTDGESSNANPAKPDHIRVQTNGEAYEDIQDIFTTGWLGNGIGRKRWGLINGQFSATTNPVGTKIYSFVQTETKTGGNPPYAQNQPILVSRNASQLKVSLINLDGRSGFAGGVFLPLDHGDAPESYGEAANLMENWETTGTPNSLTDPAGWKLNTKPPYLGANAPLQDHGKNWLNGNFTGDPEEDLTASTSTEVGDFPRYVVTTNGAQMTENYVATIPVTAADGTKVYAWLDINRNGEFDVDLEDPTNPEKNPERAVGTVSGGKATLTWSNPNTTTPGFYAIRVRVNSDGSVITNPVATVRGGETEDLQVEWTAVTTKPATTVGFKGEIQKSTDNDPVAIRGITDAGLTPDQMFLSAPAEGATYSLQGSDTNEVSIPNQGKYTIDPTTGIVTFDPDPAFVGTANAVTIVTQTQTKQKISSTYQARVVPPLFTLAPADVVGVLDTTTRTTELTPVYPAEVAKNTVTFPSTNQPPNTTVSDSGKELTVPNEGIWTVDNNGVFTFTRNVGFVGTPTPVAYTAKDEYGNAPENIYSNLSVTYPPVATKNATTRDDQGVTQKSTDKDAGDQGLTLDEMFPGLPLDSGVFTLEGATGNTLVLDGQGIYTFDPAAGVVTFKPLPTYIGYATPAKIVYNSTSGGTTLNATYTPEMVELNIVAPNASSTGNTAGATVNLTPDYASVNIDPKTVVFSDGTKQKIVDGQGTWTINGTTGEFSFTPQLGFIGQPTSVSYQAKNSNGVATSTDGIVTVSYTQIVPVNAKTVGEQGLVQYSTDKDSGDEGKTFDQMFPGAKLSWGSLSLDNPAGGELSADKEMMTVTGEGIYTLNKNTGVVTFNPDKTFANSATPVTIVFKTHTGQELRASYSPRVTAVIVEMPNAAVTGVRGQPTVITPAYSAQVDPSSVTFSNHNQPTGATRSDDGKTLTVPNQGSWTITPDGTVTFTPLLGFIAEPAQVKISGTNFNGVPSLIDGTLAVLYPPVAPVNQTSSGPQGVAQTSQGAATMFPGLPVNSGTYKLADANAEGKIVNDEGTYTIDAADGVVTFMPVPTFVGTAQPVGVVVYNSLLGETTYSALYTPTVNAVTVTLPSERATGTISEATTFKPTENGSSYAADIKLDSLKMTGLLSPEDLSQVPSGNFTISPDGRTLTIPNEGTWILNKDTGEFTFTPVEGFIGRPHWVTYTGTNNNGVPATPAKVRVAYPLITPENATTTAYEGQVQYSDDKLSADNGKTAQEMFPGIPANKPGETNWGTYALLNAANERVNTVEARAGDNTLQGTYTINSSTGIVTYRPATSFVGTASSARVQFMPTYGNVPWTATYTPTVVAKITHLLNEIPETVGNPASGKLLVPAARPAIKDFDFSTLTFDNGLTTMTVEGEGTWTVNQTDGTITFTPADGFAKDPTPVGVKVKANLKVTPELPDGGTEEYVGNVRVTYRPITPVNWASTGLQGKTQTSGSFADMFPGIGAANAYTDPALDGTNTIITTAWGKFELASTIDPAVGSYKFNADGEVEFNPVPSFTGTPTNATVTYTPAQGTSVQATYQPKVTPLALSAPDKTAGGIRGQDTAVTPTYGSDPTTSVVPSTVKFASSGQPEGSTISGSTLTVPGEGIWTLVKDENDKPTGTFTFTPDVGFIKDPTPIRYIGENADGVEATTPGIIRVTYLPVQPVDQTSSGLQGVAQTSQGAATMFPGLPVNSGTYKLADANAEGKIIVNGEGTYTINSTTGVVTFDPVKDFTGTAQQVEVIYTSKIGNVTYSAKYTPTVNAVTVTLPSERATGTISEATTFKPTENGSSYAADIKLDSLEMTGLLSPEDLSQVPSGNFTISPDGRTLTIPNEGEWTLNSTTGEFTFTPVEGFIGRPHWVTYTGTNNNGVPATPAKVRVAYPLITPENATTTAYEGQVQYSDDKLSADNGKTAQEMFPGIPANKPGETNWGTYWLLDKSGNRVTALTVASTGDDHTDHGDYTIDQSSGRVTYTPKAGFTGTADQVHIQFMPTYGNVPWTATYTPTVVAKITHLLNEIPETVGNPASGKLLVPAARPAIKDFDFSTLVFDDGTPTGTTTLTVPGEGVWTVNQTDGTITFTPADGYGKDPTPVGVKVKANLKVTPELPDGGTEEYVGNVRVTYKPVTPENQATTGLQGKTQTSGSFADMFPGIGAANAYTNPVLDGTNTIITTAWGKFELASTIDPAVGSYKFNTNGEVEFKPVPSFTGTPTNATVTYTPAQGISVQATYQPKVTPLALSAPDKTAAGTRGQDTAVTPDYGTDATYSIDPSTVEFTTDENGDLTGQPAGATLSGDGLTLTVPNEGKWKLDKATGTFTFTPDDDFIKDPTPISYTGKNFDGVLATRPGIIVVDYPAVQPVDQTSSGLQGVAQTSQGAATMFPGLPVDSGTYALSGADEHGKVEVANQGTYTINSTTGVVTFDPVKTYAGTAQSVSVVYTSKIGNISYSAKYTPTVNAATVTLPSEKAIGAINVATTFKPTENGSSYTADIKLDSLKMTGLLSPEDLSQVPSGNFTISPDGRTLTIPNEGTWILNKDTGEFTFTPVEGFIGRPHWVTYTGTNNNGVPATPAKVRVAYPLITPANATTVGFSGVEQHSNDKDYGDAGKTREEMFPDIPANDPGETNWGTYALLNAASERVTTVEARAKDNTLQGTYTINSSTGIVTYQPAAGFVGTASSARIEFLPKYGNVPWMATYTPSVIEADTTLLNLTTPAPVGSIVTSVITLPTGWTDPDYNTLQFVDGGTTKTVPNEGQWTLNTNTGEATFTPIAGFTENPTPVSVKFNAKNNGNPDEYSTKIGILYSAIIPVNQASRDLQGNEQVSGLFKDMFPGIAATDAYTNPTVNDTKTVVTTAWGTFTLSSSITSADGSYAFDNSGKVVFTPTAGFTGSPEEAVVIFEPEYGSAIMAIYQPEVDPLTLTAPSKAVVGERGVATDVTPDYGTDATHSIKKETVRFSTTGQPSGANIVDDSKMTVQNEGTWTIDGNGKFTFTPYPGFIANPAPISYTGKNAKSVQATTPGTITVSYPVVVPTSAATVADQGVTQHSNDTGVGDAGKTPAEMFPNLPLTTDWATFNLLDSGGNKVTTVEARAKDNTLQGTYTIATNGVVTFTPVPTFIGEATPVTVVYTSKDDKTSYSTLYTPTVNKVTVTLPDMVHDGTPAQQESFTPTYDSSIDLGSLKFTTDDLASHTTEPISVSDTGKMLFIPGEGTWTLDANGQFTFKPEVGFLGDPQQVTYTGTNSNGVSATPGTVRVAYTSIVPRNAATIAYEGQVQYSDDKQSADNGLTTQEMFPGIPANTATEIWGAYALLDNNGNRVTSWETARGEYEINPISGRVAYTPKPGTSGFADTVTLQFKPKYGGVTWNATYTTVVIQKITQLLTETPETIGSPASGKLQIPAARLAIDNFDFSTLVFDDGTPTGTDTLTVPGEGVWTVNQTDGTITFTPADGFAEDPTPVGVKVIANLKVTPELPDGGTEEFVANVRVTYKSVTPVNQASRDLQGKTQTSGSFADMFPGIAATDAYKITSQEDTKITTAWGMFELSSKVDPTVGSYKFNANGEVEFEPVPSFIGTPEKATVTYTPTQGTPIEAAYRPEVNAVTLPAPSKAVVGTRGEVTAVTPGYGTDDTNSIDPSTVRFTDDGQPANSTLSLDKLTLLVTGEGIWRVNNGKFTFTPQTGFIENPAPISYTGQNTYGVAATTPGTVEVTYPVVVTASAATVADQGVTQHSNDKDNSEAGKTPAEMFPNLPLTTDWATFNLLDSGNNKVTTVEARAEDDTLQGTYTIATDGVVTFTPEPTFIGEATPVTVVYTSKNNKTSYQASYAPLVLKVTVTLPDMVHGGEPAQQESFTPTYNSNIDLGSLKFTTAGLTSLISSENIELRNNGRELFIPGEGTWTLDADGQFTFKPEMGFLGDPQQVTYTGTDKNDVPAGIPGKVQVTYEAIATKNATTLAYEGQVQYSDDKQSADAGLTTQEMFPGIPANNVGETNWGSYLLLDDEGNRVTTLSDASGDYTIDESFGRVTYTPKDGFTGIADPVQIQFMPKYGNVPWTATYAPTVIAKITQLLTEIPETIGAAASGTLKVPAGRPAIKDFDFSTLVFSNGEKTLKVDGEGTWTTGNDGMITFTPADGFAKDPTPVGVKVTANLNAGGTEEFVANVRVTYSMITPVNQASRDLQGRQQTSGTFADMFPGIAATDAYTITSQEDTKITTAWGTFTLSSGIEASDGSYAFNADGKIVFTPDPGFIGTPARATVTYTPRQGTPIEATYRPEVNALTLPAPSKTVDGVRGEDTKIELVYIVLEEGGIPSANLSIVPSTVEFTTEGLSPEASVRADGKELTVPNEGKWTLDNTGKFTFTPAVGFTADPTPVSYTGKNVYGVSATTLGKVGVNYPAIVTVAAATVGEQGVPQHSNDTGVGDAGKTPEEMFPGLPLNTADDKWATFSLLDAEGNNVPELAVDGQGTYKVNSDTGVVTFKPLSTFVGEADHAVVVYTSTVSKTSYWSDYAPSVTKVEVTLPSVIYEGPLAQPVSFKPSYSDDIVLDSLKMTTNGLVSWIPGQEATVSEDGRMVLIPGEGTWTLAADGTFTFDPVPGFIARPQFVTYTGTNENGVPTEAKVRVAYPHVVPVNAATTGVQGTIQKSTDKDAGDAGLTGAEMFPTIPANPADNPTLWGSYKLEDGVGENAELVYSLPVDGVGTYTINTSTAEVTFNPDPTFFGTADPVVVRYTSNQGYVSRASYTVTVEKIDTEMPVYKGEATIGTHTNPLSADDIGYPSDIDLSTLLFAAADQQPFGTNNDGTPAPAEVSADGLSLKIPNEGTWTLDPATGNMTFTAVEGFIGRPQWVKITAKNTDGVPYERPGEVRVAYPLIGVQAATTTADQGVTQHSTDTDEGDAGLTSEQMFPTIPANRPGETNWGTYTLVGADADTNGEKLTIPGEGSYTIDRSSGEVTFKPDPTFHGRPTPAMVEFNPIYGNVPWRAGYHPLVTEIILELSDHSATGQLGQPLDATPPYPADIDPTTVELQPLILVDGTVITVINPDENGSLVVPDQGTWSVADDGTVTFTPLQGYIAAPDPVEYSAKNLNGVPATHFGKISAFGRLPEPVESHTIEKQGVAQTSDVLFPGIDASWGSVKFVDPETGNQVDSLTLKDHQGDEAGTLIFDLDTGKAVFTPVKTFVGTFAPITVKFISIPGSTELTSTYRPEVTVDRVRTGVLVGSGTIGSSISAIIEDLPVGTDDPDVESVFSPATVKILPLIAPGIEPDENGDLVVPGEGTWSYDPATNKFGFTPEGGFTGEPTRVVINPDDKGNLVVPDEGTWSYDSETGTFTFTPEAGFITNPTKVRFTGTNANGVDPTSPGVLDFSYDPVEVFDIEITGEFGEEQVSTVGGVGLDRDGNKTPATMFPDSLANLPDSWGEFSFTDSAAGTDPLLGADGKILTQIDAKDADGNTVGIFKLDPATGKVTFTPNEGFFGTVQPVHVLYKSVKGITYTASYTPTVKKPKPKPTPQPGDPDLLVPKLPKTGFSGPNVNGRAVMFTWLKGLPNAALYNQEERRKRPKRAKLSED